MSKIDKIFKKSFFEIPIFNIPCYFTESKSDFEKMSNHIGVTFDPNVGGRCQLLQHESGEVCVLIGVFEGGINTLVHETTHVVLFIIEAIGEPITSRSETIPYLNAFIFKKCKEKMKHD